MRWWRRLTGWWSTIEDEDPGAWHTPQVGDEQLRRQVDGVIRTASQTPDPKARGNQWRQTS